MNLETREKIQSLKDSGIEGHEFDEIVKSWPADSENQRISVIKNFIRPEDCIQIIDFFSKQKKQGFNSEKKFIGKTFPWQQCRRLNPNHPDEYVVKLISSYRFNATIAARDFFQKDLYPEYTDLVAWKNGEDMNVHSDSFHMDGSPRDSRGSHKDWRYCGGVLYLNDDYAGGETYFPKFNIQVKPETGKLSLFMADWEHMHGVRRVTQGRDPIARYTMPIWFTEDYTKSEI